MRPPERFPQEWLNRPHSNLARANLWTAGVYLEDLCFDAQQAAEKVVKGLLFARRIQHPFIHDLAALFLVEEVGVNVSAEMFEAATLTWYAAVTRYPGHTRPVTDEDHHEAVDLTSRVVRWVEGIL